MDCSVRCKLGQVSDMDGRKSAPESMKAGTNRSGFSIIKWTSSGKRVARRQASTMKGPIVRFGTKVPIHDIDMNPVGAGCLGLGDGVLKVQEVR